MVDKITDEELDAAADEGLNAGEGAEAGVEDASAAESAAAEVAATEAAAAEVAAAESEKPPVEDQRMKSALGRMTGLQSKIDSLESAVRQLTSSRDSDEEETGIVASEGDVIAIVEKRERLKAEAGQKYSNTAVDALLDIGLSHAELDDATYVEIHNDAEKHWKRVTGDPKQDAEINFTKALNRHLTGKLAEKAKPTNLLEKNDGVDAEGLGGGTETDVKGKIPKVPKLDAHAKDFVERTGMKAESVQEALTGDMPAYLGGR